MKKPIKGRSAPEPHPCEPLAEGGVSHEAQAWTEAHEENDRPDHAPAHGHRRGDASVGSDSALQEPKGQRRLKQQDEAMGEEGHARRCEDAPEAPRRKLCHP